MSSDELVRNLAQVERELFAKSQILMTYDRKIKELQNKESVLKEANLSLQEELVKKTEELNTVDQRLANYFNGREQKVCVAESEAAAKVEAVSKREKELIERELRLIRRNESLEAKIKDFEEDKANFDHANELLKKEQLEIKDEKESYQKALEDAIEHASKLDKREQEINARLLEVSHLEAQAHMKDKASSDNSISIRETFEKIAAAKTDANQRLLLADEKEKELTRLQAEIVSRENDLDRAEQRIIEGEKLISSLKKNYEEKEKQIEYRELKILHISRQYNIEQEIKRMLDERP